MPAQPSLGHCRGVKAHIGAQTIIYCAYSFYVGWILTLMSKNCCLRSLKKLLFSFVKWLSPMF
ncbi:hypothetical protein COCSUDRAFT_33407 [Coccomyxa subellipsoidea C-169]|uniref:Uncharacterized protein n=1 Tax=Coccomyxa subellipsoidea (strain C-169) TaxID=574566 RepID=I0YWT1_COCSC|nr:hypothetical protein COCSUDRAFT_33407 [Coccomyxa subellipsoidea C-169]EIE22850.1 hypothetical protein COCSUDRAFT_33407 [Coccomyxa subellipsoidea C-169]|eukprot:XP_005647394.1 hypothetical protein COCSUDRAFT_33407 [Coccomyxa subellipsoidea C-169]